MNLLLWLVGTIFAETAYSAVYTIFSVWEKPAFIILLIPVAAGMIFAYSLIRAKIPDVEDCELEDGVMASAIYNQRSHRRTLTLLASAAFGVLNAAALILCNLLLTGRI